MISQAFVRPSIEVFPILPVLITSGVGMLVLVVDAVFRIRSRAQVHAAISLLALIASGICAALEWGRIGDRGTRLALSGMVADDRLSVFFTLLFCTAAGLAVLVSESYLRREQIEKGEYFALILLCTSGMILMAQAADLVAVFIALELLSISLYILAGFARERLGPQESAMKYFLLGAFSSAFFLYGIALTYGATGTTQLNAIGSFLARNPILESRGVLVAGFAMLLVGLCFKVAAVPFHMWTPDVYQGAPTPVTGFMAAGAKAAGFAAILRVFVFSLQSERVDWQPVVWAVAVLTMIVGASVAIVQSDVKRMMAYSSISHAGYVMVGVSAAGAVNASTRGVEGALFYLLTYTFMVIGAFGVIGAVSREGDSRTLLSDYSGLARANPLLAGLLTLFMLGMAGFPLTSGFVAKFEVFGAAVDSRQYALAAVGMVTSVIAAFFYLRVILVMYMPAEGEVERVSMPGSLATAVMISAVFTLLLGILPGGVIDFARDAAVTFL